MIIDNTEAIQELKEELANAQDILIIQGENLDGDSVASSIALENILGEMGKNPIMYCPVAIPRHLKHLDGWDRVVDVLPKKFDFSVVLDTSTGTLLERVFSPSQLPLLRARPQYIIDHHDVEVDMPFATTNIIDIEAVSTGEAIYKIAQTLGWEIPKDAKTMIVASILYDSLGMTTTATTPNTLRVVAQLVEEGVNLPELNEKRRAMQKKAPEITKYKGQLLQRVEFSAEGQLATVHITWEEIKLYSDKYNPAVLVLDDMRLTEGVRIAIAYKTYPDGKILAKIRANYDGGIANSLAENFGGGGHKHASGFKLRGYNFEQLQREVIEKTTELFKEMDEETEEQSDA